MSVGNLLVGWLYALYREWTLFSVITPKNIPPGYLFIRRGVWHQILFIGRRRSSYRVNSRPRSGKSFDSKQNSIKHHHGQRFEKRHSYRVPDLPLYSRW